jgi:transcriptional regulator with XRE-family HTH domain
VKQRIPHERRQVFTEQIDIATRVIAGNLHRLRQENRFTLKVVSLATGISVAHINRIENGYSSAHLNTLQKLADVYGVSIAALFEGSDM